MTLNRRQILTAAASGTAAYALSCAPPWASGLNAAQFGVNAGAADDQSRALQRAINRAAASGVPLSLPPGVYRAGNLTLPAGAHIVGVPGSTRILFTSGPSLMSSEHASSISLTGLTFDGSRKALPKDRGLIHFNTGNAVTIDDCAVIFAGGNAIALERCQGSVTRTTITDAKDNAIFCLDGKDQQLTGNTIARSGNGGIRVWQSEKRRDGSLVADNQIDNTRADGGGDGENGNAINAFRAADVTVRNNKIRKAAFSAVRGNAASNFKVTGNVCSDLDETAMYAEFDYVGAFFENNVIEGAENGISVTNYDHGGRLGLVKGNTVRNLRPRRPGSPPEGSGVGIAAEAETIVTGNLVEFAAQAGIRAGWGQYLKDVRVSGNTVRHSNAGIEVSVVANAGRAVITDNQLVSCRRGAVIGMEWNKPVTGDLTRAGAERYPHLRVAGNQVS